MMMLILAGCGTDMDDVQPRYAAAEYSECLGYVPAAYISPQDDDRFIFSMSMVDADCKLGEGTTFACEPATAVDGEVWEIEGHITGDGFFGSNLEATIDVFDPDGAFLCTQDFEAEAIGDLESTVQEAAVVSLLIVLIGVSSVVH